MNVPLLVICGPTGSGKSALAVKLATVSKGEIVNCDSLQVYRHFDIGTAKLPECDRAGIPHYLIDVTEAAEGFTAGEFARLARPILSEIAARGHLPIVAGGTGFYLRALLDGLSPMPAADPRLREKLRRREARRAGALHRILTRLNPAAAQRIHANDLPKLIRALEIRLASAPADPTPERDALRGYRTLKLALFPPRDALYAALDRRCEAMLVGGLLEEIAGLLSRGVDRSSKPFESLGYKEGLAILEGRMTRDEALAAMQQDTRRYAKRQMTWFRHEPGVVMLNGFGSDPDIEAAAADLTGRLLSDTASGAALNLS